MPSSSNPAPVLRSQSVIAALSVSASGFCLFFGYEMVRSASNTLFKKAYGADSLVYVMAGTPVGVLAALWLYGRLLNAIGPRRTLLLTTVASGAAIAFLSVLIRDGSNAATAALYIVREAYIVLIIEQYWSFLNSRFTVGEARWLNGPTSGLASLGPILAGLYAGRLTEALGHQQLPLLAAASCLPAALCSEVGYRFAGEPADAPQHPGSDKNRESSESTIAADLGLPQFRAHPVLVFMLLVVIATQVVSTSLDLRFQSELQAAIPDGDQQTAYSIRFFGLLSAFAAAGQFVLAPLLLQVVPLRWIHLAIPCLHLTLAALAFSNPTLGSIGLAYLTFKAVDYSLFKSAKELLYIPLPFDARYRAKEVIDVFGYRFSKGAVSTLAAAAKLAGVKLGGWWLPAAMGASLVWIALALGLTRQRPLREQADARNSTNPVSE